MLMDSPIHGMPKVMTLELVPRDTVYMTSSVEDGLTATTKLRRPTLRFMIFHPDRTERLGADKAHRRRIRPRSRRESYLPC